MSNKTDTGSKKHLNIPARFKNKAFWVSFIPAVLLLISVLLDAFGVKFDLTGVQEEVLTILDSVYALLAILGVFVDPTTEGFRDSKLAMTYVGPKPYGAEDEPSEAPEEQQSEQSETEKE